MITIHTNLGDIKLQLNAEKAPLTVANFMKYVDEGFFDGTIFHRVIDGFMIQGGGFNEDMSQKRCNEPVKTKPITVYQIVLVLLLWHVLLIHIQPLHSSSLT